MKDAEAKLIIDTEVQPKFYRPRPVPYALKERVGQELDRLEHTGVIEKIPNSEWAAPIVPVVKPDGSIRICGDYKLTANKAAKTESYPLPKVEDIFSSLSGGKLFTTLDLAHAYNQIPLDLESQKLVVLNTHKGLYRYKRLPFGIASAPAVFQRTMENLLRDIPGVSVYLDDILVTGKSLEDHIKNLEEVFIRLERAGVRLKKTKCKFMRTSLEYLGHVISEKGLQPSKKNLAAIRGAPEPQDVSQLKSFLGLVNYYGKFLPNLASTLSPLYALLRKNCKWHWEESQKQAFEEAKIQLASERLLVHYDSEKPLLLACDASPYGIGAVMSHRFEDGSERLIAYASRSLAPAEKQYSQLEKEALAIVFGIKKFHQFLYGRKFVILSDHKPLQGLFNETKGIPLLASARIQRWALTLSAYDYTIQHKKGAENCNADMLSRLPLPETPVQVPYVLL